MLDPGPHLAGGVVSSVSAVLVVEVFALLRQRVHATADVDLHSEIGKETDNFSVCFTYSN